MKTGERKIFGLSTGSQIARRLRGLFSKENLGALADLIKRLNAQRRKVSPKNDSSGLHILDVESTLNSGDFVPQAIVKRTIEELAEQFQTRITESSDDFDNYKGLAFRFNDLLFTVLHYSGHPAGLSTIYLLRHIKSVPEITDYVKQIAHALHIAPSEIEWQRKDDPDL